jgi:hypothetical protein
MAREVFDKVFSVLYFEKIKVGLSNHHSISEFPHQPIFVKPGVYISAREPT